MRDAGSRMWHVARDGCGHGRREAGYGQKVERGG